MPKIEGKRGEKMGQKNNLKILKKVVEKQLTSEKLAHIIKLRKYGLRGEFC